MNEDEISMVLDLVLAYADWTAELSEVYYLQDGAKIDAAEARVNECEKRLGIVWAAGVPWLDSKRLEHS